MREDQIDQAERLATLENDRKVLEQRGSTFHQHAQAQAGDLAGGRFGAATGAPHVVGSQAQPRYPAAAAHQADPCGIEPPLNFSVNDMPSLEPSTGTSSHLAVEHLGGAAVPSRPSDVEPAPPSSSAIGGGLAPQEFPACGSTAKAGLSPTNPKSGNG
jgi:hypothetical protein